MTTALLSRLALAAAMVSAGSAAAQPVSGTDPLHRHGNEHEQHAPAPAPAVPAHSHLAPEPSGHDAHRHRHPAAPALPGPQAMPPVPPLTPAERAAAFPALDDDAHDHMEAEPLGVLEVERLELQDGDDDPALAWEAAAYWGDAFDRLWLTTEGEYEDGASEELRTELAWTHAVTRWWESLLGLRHDGGPGPDRGWVGFGFAGTAPFFIEVEAVAYLGEAGRSALTLAAEHDSRLTNRLILQSHLELNAYGEADPERGLGSGLADSEFGLRLRYELRREFAPYAGVEWTRRHGDSASLARADGERRGEARAVAGVSFWF